MQRVGLKQQARIQRIVDKLVASGVYPSASKVAKGLGRKPQKYKGDGLNASENRFRRALLENVGIALLSGKTSLLKGGASLPAREGTGLFEVVKGGAGRYLKEEEGI